MSGPEPPPGSLWRAGWYGYARRLAPTPPVPVVGIDRDTVVVEGQARLEPRCLEPEIEAARA